MSLIWNWSWNVYRTGWCLHWREFCLGKRNSVLSVWRKYWLMTKAWGTGQEHAVRITFGKIDCNLFVADLQHWAGELRCYSSWNGKLQKVWSKALVSSVFLNVALTMTGGQRREEVIVKEGKTGIPTIVWTLCQCDKDRERKKKRQEEASRGKWRRGLVMVLAGVLSFSIENMG